jgi:mRNA interferase MazF
MRGDVYRLKAPKSARARELDGPGYAVVVQSDDLPLSTWIVAPTSTRRAPGPIRPEVVVGDERTRVLTDHLVALDPQSRLGAHVCRLTFEEMRAVDRALLLVLGLD